MKALRACCQLFILAILLIQTVYGQEIALKAEQRAESSPILQLADSLLEARAYKQANVEIAKVMKQLNPEEDMRLFIEALELEAKIKRRVDERGWEAAIPIINRAVQLAREHLELGDILLASVYQTQSRAYHFSNEFYTARAAIDTSMSLYKMATSSDSALYESIIDLKYYTYYYSSGSTDTLIEYVNQRYQRELRKKEKDPEEILYIMQDFPDMYSDIGDYEKALTYAIQSYKYAEENKALILGARGGFETYANTFKNLMDVMLNRRDFDKALQMGKRILETMQENDIKVSDYVEYYAVIGNMGRAYDQMGNFEEALKYYNQALDIGTETVQNAIFYARMKLFIGDCLINLGEFQEGKQALLLGLDILKKNSESPSPALHNPYDAYGDFLRAQQEYQQALFHYDSALMNSLPNNVNRWYEFPRDSTQDLSLDQVLTIANKGALFDKLNNDSLPTTKLYQYGLNYAEELHQILVGRRQEFEVSEGKLFLSERFRFIYESALNFAFRLYQENPDNSFFREALKFARRSKSILFLEQANEYEKVNNNVIDRDLKNSFNNYKKSLDELEAVFYRLIDNDVTSDSIVVLNDSLVSLRTSLATVLDTIEQELNAANFEGFGDFFDEGIDKIRPQKKTVTFEFFYGREHIYVLSTGPKEHRFYRVPVKDDFEHRLEAVVNYVSKPPVVSSFFEDQRQFAAYSNRLYAELIAPGIDGNKSIDRIIVVPDQFLSRLPFEALVTEYDPNQAFEAGHYLINQFNIRYELSSLLTNQKSSKATKNSVLGLGFASSESSTYANLPGTDREINFLKATYKGTFINSASKEQFLALSSDYDIIHLAVHGKSDTLNKYESSLIFSTGEDQELKTSDLYLAGLNARLAILSACESGVGTLNKGEGTFSIARGFALSGVPSVVMSLWKVNDGVTSKLMERIYENFIEEGYSINSALALSKKEYLRGADSYFSHPFYWASFIQLGEDISFEERANKSYLLLLALLIMVVVLFVLGKKKRTI